MQQTIPTISREWPPWPPSIGMDNIGLPPLLSGWVCRVSFAQASLFSWFIISELSRKVIHTYRRESHGSLTRICSCSLLWLRTSEYGLCWNTLRPRQNGRHFQDDIFKCIFFNENIRILRNISLKFVPEGSINNIPALVQIMAWRRPGDKPLSEAVVASLLTHICVTRPQWVKESE